MQIHLVHPFPNLFIITISFTVTKQTMLKSGRSDDYLQQNSNYQTATDFITKTMNYFNMEFYFYLFNFINITNNPKDKSSITITNLVANHRCSYLDMEAKTGIALAANKRC